MGQVRGRRLASGGGVPVGEVVGWLFLTMFVFVCISVGVWASRLSGRVTVWSALPVKESETSAIVAGKVLRLEVIPNRWALSVPIKEPWQIKPEDLTTERVLYNMLTKEGYRWLMMQMMLVVVGGLLASLGMSWLYRHKLKALGRIEEEKLAIVELSGSVEVRHQQGIIYWARQVGLNQVADTFEEFGTWMSGSLKRGRMVKGK